MAFHSSCSSDRAASGAKHIPMPPLLATAAVHERLITAGCGPAPASSSRPDEARDAHQVGDAHRVRRVRCVSVRSASTRIAAVAGADAHASYQHALEHGLLKIMSKMGVTTIAGYCGSALFDIVGLDPPSSAAGSSRHQRGPRTGRRSSTSPARDGTSSRCVRGLGVSARLSRLPLDPPQWRAACVRAGRGQAAPQVCRVRIIRGLRRLRGARRRTTSDRDPGPADVDADDGHSRRASRAAGGHPGALLQRRHVDWRAVT